MAGHAHFGEARRGDRQRQCRFPTYRAGHEQRKWSYGAIAFLLLAAVAARAAEVEPAPAPSIPLDDTRPVLRIDAPGEPVALTLADIERLPLRQTTLKTAWGMEGTFQGVLLTDLLAAHGLGEAERVRLRALDDYSVSVTRSRLRVDPALLVTRKDGEPLTLVQAGPLILMWPSLAEEVLAGTSPMATWIWSVSEIVPE